MSSVTMRMVAEVAGVHQTTVSLALRGHPRIPAKTAERIREVAGKMGYRPNPLVSAFAASRRRRDLKVTATLGYVTADETFERRAYRALADGFRKRAGELGYGVDLLSLSDVMLTRERFHQITTTRNIHGLMIAPLSRRRQTLELNWERFASVAYGYSVAEPEIHRVSPDFYHSMFDILRRCRDAGWQRVGLILSEVTDRKSDHFWLASFLAGQHSSPELKILPPLVLPKWEAQRAEAWFRRHRPQVVLGLCSMLGQAERWTRSKAGAAFRPQWVALNASSQAVRGHYAGITLNRELSGATCAEILVGMLHRNERGIPANTLDIFTKTGWQDGKSFRARS